MSRVARFNRPEIVPVIVKAAGGLRGWGTSLDDFPARKKIDIEVRT